MLENICGCAPFNALHNLGQQIVDKCKKCLKSEKGGKLVFRGLKNSFFSLLISFIGECRGKYFLYKSSFHFLNCDFLENVVI